MKKLLIVLFSLGMAVGASAQRVHVGGGFHGGGYHYVRPRVVISSGFYSPFYSPYYSPYFGFGYPYWGFPPAYNGYNHRPTQLDIQIQDIKNDYTDRNWSARQDKNLSGHARRQKVRELKHERDQAVNQAKVDYYKRPRTYNNNRSNNNNNRNNNNDNGNNNN